MDYGPPCVDLLLSMWEAEKGKTQDYSLKVIVSAGSSSKPKIIVDYKP